MRSSWSVGIDRLLQGDHAQDIAAPQVSLASLRRRASSRAVLRTLDPQLDPRLFTVLESLPRFKNVEDIALKDPVQKALLDMEDTLHPHEFKFGVLYVRDDQQSEEQIFGNRKCRAIAPAPHDYS